MNKYFIAIKQILAIYFTIMLFVTMPAIIFTLITSKGPMLNGIRSFVVLTGSMEPTLPVGSIVYTKPQSYYKVGDVISFKQGSVNITHRIVGVEKDGYLTKGDANNSIDTNIVKNSQILGKQIYRVFNAGKFILYLRTLPGFLIFLILPTFIFISFELWSIKKELTRELEKKLRQKLLQEIHGQI